MSFDGLGNDANGCSDLSVLGKTAAKALNAELVTSESREVVELAAVHDQYYSAS